MILFVPLICLTEGYGVDLIIFPNVFQILNICQCLVANMANEPETILGKLKAQNLIILQQRDDKIPSRGNSKTNQTFTSKEKQIKQLKNELQQLKTIKKQQPPK